MSNPGLIRVWDIAVRILHWTLVTGFVAAYVSRDMPGPWHEWLGYFVLVVVMLRAALGFGGTHYARFRQFVRSLTKTFEYTRAITRGQQPRYIGHNPLGGWMIVGLLLMVTLTCVSGWLYTTDRFWGLEWVEDLHNLLTWITIAMVVLHVLGVIVTSFHDHENLVASMFHGRKRAPREGDVV
jgi:cytochrome b